MPRNRRLNMTLSEDEYSLLMSVKPEDMSLAATVRRLAIHQATWLAERGRKQEPIVPRLPYMNTGAVIGKGQAVPAAASFGGAMMGMTDKSPPAMPGEITIDTSESQDRY